MPRKWTANDYSQLVVISTACLCLVILVLGTVIGVMNHTISPEVLGNIQGASVGGGLLGLGLILYRIIKVALGGTSSEA
ncbi:MAG: hypothetical protein P8173_12645 [Gammaproteobacteria bacterium]|jgi:hypothetical protein